MTKHFTMDNTDGYTQTDLDELNRRFDAVLKAEEPIADDIRESHEGNIAARVQAEFDNSDWFVE